MEDFEARRRLNELKKEVGKEHRERTRTQQHQTTYKEKPMPRRKLKIRALLMGFLASFVSTLLFALFVILPLVLLMRLFGTSSFMIADRLKTSVLGIAALLFGFVIINWSTGYAIAFFAKHAPFYNITIYYIIGPAIFFSLWFLALLLNASRSWASFELWDILKMLAGVFVAYIGGTFAKR